MMRPWLLLALAASCLAQPAAAFDLTGTWEGKQTCKGSDGAKFTFSFPSTLRITQTGTVLAIEVVSSSDVYNGAGIDGTAKPKNGEAYFVHCGTTDVPATGNEPFDETGRASVKTHENGGGTFKGASSFYNGAPATGTCKWSYKRTSTTNPAVLGCPDV